MVYNGRQEAHVLQRPSGEKSLTCPWPVNMLEMISHSRHMSFVCSVEFREWCRIAAVGADDLSFLLIRRCLPGRVRSGRGLHRQQGEQLHRAAGLASIHTGLPLEPRHHHRHAGQEVSLCLWNGSRATWLDSCLPEGHQSANEAAGICRCVKKKRKKKDLQ